MLNQSLANEFFGNWKNAMGKTIQMWSFRIPLKVVGVFKDLPANTEMQIKMGASYPTFHALNAHGLPAMIGSTSHGPRNVFYYCLKEAM